ncbi:hypothetical protein PRUPE_4G289500 [Prunus persica]|uniref:Uncharacterized protein n=1 Tax=Prunus persica TaxID=3760 RepID=A0A251PSU2_PRUPE|nr:hypothetical protein PRUPE_4G289500 [Prunus persica]
MRWAKYPTQPSLSNLFAVMAEMRQDWRTLRSPLNTTSGYPGLLNIPKMMSRSIKIIPVIKSGVAWASCWVIDNTRACVVERPDWPLWLLPHLPRKVDCTPLLDDEPAADDEAPLSV